ncbi:MAG: PAS domain S-box protein [Flavobacteriales bacterium]
MSLLEHPVFIMLVIALTAITITLILKRFGRISLEGIEFYSSLAASVNKIRILSILSALLIPLIGYIETEFLHLYTLDWYLMGGVVASSLFTLIYSFNPRITIARARLAPIASYSVVYSLMVLMAFDADLPHTLAIETALIILFSKVIHNSTRENAFFLVWSFALNAAMIFANDSIPSENLALYISTATQCALVLVGLLLAEGAGLNQLSFSNKVLENSGLIIMVREPSGRVVYSNKSAQTILGVKDNALLGEGWWNHINATPEHRKISRDYIAKAIATGDTKVYQSTNVKTAAGTGDIEWRDTVLDRKFLINFGREVTDEMRLRTEIRKLYKVSTSTSTGFVRTDKNGKVVWANESLLNIIGYKEAEFKGMLLLDLMTSPKKESVPSDSILQTNRLNKPTELQIWDKKGARKWVLANATPIYDRANKVEEIFELWTDISEDKKLQEDYEYLVNNAADVIYTADYQGFILFVNQTASNLLKRPAAEIVGKHFTELLHPNDVEKVSEYYANQFKTLTPHSFLEFRIVDATGKTKWIQQTTKLEQSPDNPNWISGFQAIARDITEQKDLESKYEFIVSNATDGIYIADYKGHFTYVNDSMKSILGYEPSEIIGKHFKDVVFPDDLNRVEEFYQSQLKKKRLNTHFEFRIVNKNGIVRWVGQNVKAVFDEKNPDWIEEFHCIVRDISETKQYEQALDRLSLVARKTNNIIIILDRERRIEWINDAFTHVFGYRSDEVIGKIPREILNGPKTDQGVIDEIERKFHLKEHVQAELINHTKDGKEVWIEISMDPLIGPNGELQGYIAVEQEITQRKVQEETIRRQNQDILDSITYSKRIQKSTVTSSDIVKELIPDSFVLYSPKDIVSGDFYLVEKIKSKARKNWTAVVVGDCTGHGVPGAMLSVMCSSVLKQAFAEDLSTPAEILQYTRDKLSDFFAPRTDTEVLDGMDASVCLINEEMTELLYSGANRPILIETNGKIQEIRGDRQSVGRSDTEEPFTNHHFKMSPGQVIYLYTDGIIDQFGGPNQRRFTTKRLVQTIEESAQKPERDIREDIRSTVLNWMKDRSQTDDICFIGIRF